MVEKEFIEKLNNYRDFLIERTEFFQNEAYNTNASKCGSHYDRGHASAFIWARKELEEMFDLWN